ncbi:MAG: hypothetical protein AABZ80_06835, partial [Gemmatimonadota bacterium]
AKPFAVAPLERSELLEETSRVAKAARQWNVVLDAEADIGRLRSVEGDQGHTDSELRAVEARWVLSLVPAEASSLLSCANSPLASAEHRVDAALLAVRVAHEIGDFRLAHEAYAAVASIPSEPGASNRSLLQLVYHTSFGDPHTAITTALSMREGLQSHDIATQLRVSRNLGVALCFLGHSDQGFALHKHYYDVASRLELTHWQFELASSCCLAAMNTESFELAEYWYDRASEVRRPGVASGVDLSHLLSGLELALQRKRPTEAQAVLAELRKKGTGESIRVKAHMVGMETRVAQMDPSFQSSQDSIAEMRRLLKLAIPLLSADVVVLALGEALRRHGHLEELRDDLRQYLSSRRDRAPFPNQVVHLAHACNLDLADC